MTPPSHLPPPSLSGQKAAVPVGVAWRAVCVGGGCVCGSGVSGGLRSVGESLTGLFPAAGGAPHVTVLHPVHLTALLPLATHLPTEDRRRAE